MKPLRNVLILLVVLAAGAFGTQWLAQQQPDRFGQVKSHPLLSVERDSRAQYLAALKALNLDLEPLRDKPGRPGGSWGS